MPRSVAPITVAGQTLYVMTNPGNTQLDDLFENFAVIATILDSIAGVPGPQGPAGPQGPQGVTGPQGPAGRDWSAGRDRRNGTARGSVTRSHGAYGQGATGATGLLVLTAQIAFLQQRQPL